MLNKNIEKFFDAAMTDMALAAKLPALATENGYDFTATELLELGEAKPLSDGEAENVAAGSIYSWSPYGPGRQQFDHIEEK